MKIDVQALDVDFYSISAHKMYGPTGVGVLYGKELLLNDSPPWRGGGEMIETVTFEKTTYNTIPHKFEAGTPHIEGVIALGAAVCWMEEIGVENIQSQEERLRAYATQELKKIDGMRILADVEPKAAVVSFLVGEIHPYDMGTLLDQMGIAVRTGHHCTEPLMTHFQIPGTVRASFAVYNTMEEVDALVEGVKRAATILQ
jgi:cysteine desulfurase/selenocysteine lyase